MDGYAFGDTAHVLVQGGLGQVSEGDWPSRLRASKVDVLRLDRAEAQRSRLRKRTEGGVDVAIALERGVQLRDGDVLGWDEASQTAIVARVDLGEVLVIDLGSLLDEPAETLLSRCVEVGHALGNQHWPAVVKGSQVYVPLTVTQKAMEAVIEAHRVAGAAWWFAPSAEVLRALSPQEARRLFGVAPGHADPGEGDESSPDAT